MNTKAPFEFVDMFLGLYENLPEKQRDLATSLYANIEMDNIATERGQFAIMKAILLVAANTRI